MPPLKGVVKITAILQNPDGLWEDEVKLEYPAGAERDILLQSMVGLTQGLLRPIGESEIEFIPINRVKSISAKIEPANISLATTLPLPIGKLRHQ